MFSSYINLKTQHFCNGNFSIVPIRFQDRYDIMRWRNEQLYHLRQQKPLTEDNQDIYFNTVVAPLFTVPYPAQMLFSYLENNCCIGYGGLVHINWIDRNAEVSFIIDTALEENHFEYHWINYLNLIEQVAFQELDLHKIYTFAFDLRPHLYTVIEKAGFVAEARLKEHCCFEGKFIDVVIHGRYNAL